MSPLEATSLVGFLLLSGAALIGLGWSAIGRRERLSLALACLAALGAALLEHGLPASRLVAASVCAALILLFRTVQRFIEPGGRLRDSLVYALLPLGVLVLFGAPFHVARQPPPAFLESTLVFGVTLAANMVLLVNGMPTSRVRRHRLMARFLTAACLLTIARLPLALTELFVSVHGVGATAMRDAALAVMLVAQIALSFLAIGAHDAFVKGRTAN